jgi:hypothetical protein
MSSGEKDIDVFVLRPSRKNNYWKTCLSVYFQLFDNQAAVFMVVFLDPQEADSVQLKDLAEFMKSFIGPGESTYCAPAIVLKERDEFSKVLSGFKPIHELPFSDDFVLGARPAAVCFYAALRQQNRVLDESRDGQLTVILDYTVQPFSIGDFIAMMAAAIAAAHLSARPVVNLIIFLGASGYHADPVMRSWTQGFQQFDRLMAFLQLIELASIPCSVRVFRSTELLNKFLAKISANNHFWPALETINNKKYLYYDAVQLIGQYHRRVGVLPALKFSPTIERWAREFIARNSNGKVAVSVNLRNNKKFGADRNFSVDSWRQFFKRCSVEYPVTFFIVGEKGETEETLGVLPNVVFSKNAGTSLLQDLSLVRLSAFHLGSSSGPSFFAMLLDKPYHIFNNDAVPHLARYNGSCLFSNNGELVWSWASELQAIGVEPESEALIMEKFLAIWNSQKWVGAL